MFPSDMKSRLHKLTKRKLGKNTWGDSELAGGYVISRNFRSKSKNYDFGPDKFKLEIVLTSRSAITIDAKKIQFWLQTEQVYDPVPVFQAYELSDEDCFNLSLQYNNVPTPQELIDIRAFMIKHFKNKSVSLYYERFVLAFLTPDKW